VSPAPDTGISPAGEPTADGEPAAETETVAEPAAETETVADAGLGPTTYTELQPWPDLAEAGAGLAPELSPDLAALLDMAMELESAPAARETVPAAVEAAPSGADADLLDLASQTVPLAPFTSFAAIAPMAPAVSVAGLDASQAGLAVASTRIGVPAAGITGILGQDHRRGDLSQVRLVFPRLGVSTRQAWWIWRGVAAIVACALFAALIAWPVGLAAATLVVTMDAVYRSRTSPAFSPTARAASARRRTRRRLARLGSLGYLSLHARAIPGTDAVIDHLVVGPTGIYAVDSEVWDRRLPVRATRGGKLFHGPRDQAARLEHAQWEASQAARLIGAALGQPVTARPAMVIYGPTVPWIVVRIAGVDVFCGRRLGRYLRREAYGRSRCLDDRQIEVIHEVAADVLPPAP
jgi:hypothetical protein